MWTPGDVSGSETLTAADRIYAMHINEMREAIALRVSLAADLGGTVDAPKVKSRTADFTLAPSGGLPADYLCEGTADQVELQAAHDALPATGGKIYLRGGIYNWTGKVNISKNVEIELAANAVIKAAVGAAGLSLGTGQPGLFHIYKSTGTQAGVHIHGGSIDANNIADVSHMSIWGAGTDKAVWTSSEILVENVRFLNKGNTTFSSAMVRVLGSGIGSGNPDVGRIKDITFRDCYSDTSDKGVVDLSADYLLDVQFIRCRFRNTQHHTISFGGIIANSWKRVRFQGCQFLNTKLSSAPSITDILDGNLRGGEDLEVIGCYFSNAGDPLVADHRGIHMQGWQRFKVIGCTFLQMWEAVSWAGSQSGTNWSYSGCNEVIFSHNIVDTVSSVFDMDDSYIMEINNNIFKDCGFEIFGAYSQHYYTEFQDNIIYDANINVENSTIVGMGGATIATLSEGSKAAIRVGGNNRMLFSRNTVIDDRLLQDPGASVATLTQVTSGARGGLKGGFE